MMHVSEDTPRSSCSPHPPVHKGHSQRLTSLFVGPRWDGFTRFYWPSEERCSRSHSVAAPQQTCICLSKSASWFSGRCWTGIKTLPAC